MNASEIQSFLGLASYYCWFIKDFSKIAKPMTRLLKKNNNFDWTEECFTTGIRVCTDARWTSGLIRISSVEKT
jgi:hypothetical protein